MSTATVIYTHDTISIVALFKLDTRLGYTLNYERSQKGLLAAYYLVIHVSIIRLG